MNIVVEGKTIEAQENMSILKASLEAGIYIPHLCNHPNLEAVGGCRLCSVEVEGLENPVPSCKTTVQEGMIVRINSEKAAKTRKIAMELILATHPADCTGCPKYGKCELQSMFQYMGVGPERWRKKSRTVPTDTKNPLIQHLFTRCVRCGRCIQACRDLRGVKVLDFQRTPEGIRVGTESGVSLEEAGCKFCGACIEVCPTGSIMDALGMIKENTAYRDSVIPCQSACPAQIDIPRYIRYIKEGDFQKATAVVREKVPFPETLGSICDHICETSCKRGAMGYPISICKLKRAAAVADDGSWKLKVRRAGSTGKKVAIVGAGPAGLTSAYYLAKKGHQVTVYEENEKAGGQCRYGIPAYRLPDEVLDKEIADILATGINLVLNTRIGIPKELLQEGFDVVLVAVGTHQGTLLPLKGNHLAGVYVNADFLKKARQKKAVDLPERVMVLGGGNVAYDCARTALRLGAKEVHIACLESLEQMTASAEEREEGLEEGIILHASHAFLQIVGKHQVEGVELQTIRSFRFDEKRVPVLELVEGSNRLIPVDSVIFAVGQKPCGTEMTGLDLMFGCYIKTDVNLGTNVPGVFAAGDAVTGTKSVIAAIAAGRQSAEAIDRYLGGDGDITEQLLEEEAPNPYIGRDAGFAKLERNNPELADPLTRKASFTPVEAVLSRDRAIQEATRCLQCDLRLNLEQPKLWNEY